MSIGGITRVGGRRDRLIVGIIGGMVLAGFLLLLLWRTIFVPILPGHVGVLYRLFLGGTVVERVLNEGLQVKFPWNRIYIFEVRVQARDFQVFALSAEGMPINVEITTLFRVERDTAGRLLKEVGTDYIERIVRPLSIGSVREVIARFDSHELYTVDARELQLDILEFLQASKQGSLIHYQDVKIRSIKLPQRVVAAIEEKLAQEQLAASYQFRLARQRQEAERLRIEGIGLRNFYSVVSSALTDQLLTWRGIEATVRLADSPNSKVVIVGGGKDQLPLILGGELGSLPKPSGEVLPVGPDAGELPDWLNLPPIFEDPMGNIYHRPATQPGQDGGDGGKWLPGYSDLAPGVQPTAAERDTAAAKGEVNDVIRSEMVDILRSRETAQQAASEGRRTAPSEAELGGLR